MGRKLNMKQQRKPTLREKRLAERQVAIVAQVSQEAVPKLLPRFEAKTRNQRTALQMLTDGKPIVLLTGSAGTGKSMTACYRAASLLNSKKIDKLYLVRPAVSVGKSIGLLPGEIEEKMAPYFAQTIAHLERFLGAGYVKYALEKGVIEMKPAEYLRGMSFENCVVIIEEAQNFTHEEMEMMVTRLGENCQLIFTGDEKQNDLKTTSGLKSTVALVNKMLQTHPEYLDHDDIDALDECIGVVTFQPEDVVRSGLTRALVKMYFHND